MTFFSFIWRSKAIAVVFLSTVLFVALASAYGRTTYYIDGDGGDDSNNGTSKTTAWKSLAKIDCSNTANITYIPGDTILLKSGCTFAGQIWPKGSGTPNQPIVIDKYGTGPKPIIAASYQGTITNNDAGVLLQEVQGWEVNNLEIINTRSNGRAGIKVFNSQAGKASYFHFKNLSIHKVPGVPQGSTNPAYGGFIFKSSSTAQFDDILVDSCEIYDIGWIGLQFSFYDLTIDVTTRSTNCIIRNTIIRDCGYAGIFWANSNKALFENCKIYNTGSSPTAATYLMESYGVQIKMNTGTKIKNCESYSNSGYNNSGYGFGLGVGAVACTLQYNYSHDNKGGFVNINSGTVESSGNIVRYNVSQNDAVRSFYIKGAKSNALYNNSIFVASTTTLNKVLETSNSTGNLFTNNILFINKSAGYDATGSTWDYNCFFGSNTNFPTDAHKITVDPQFVSAGGASTGISSAAVYKLKPGSPCIDAGTIITNNGGKDFWGSIVPDNNKTDIGAYEGPGTNSTAVVQGHAEKRSGTPSFAHIFAPQNRNLQVKILTNGPYSIGVFTAGGRCIAQRTGKGADLVEFAGQLLDGVHLLTVSSGSKTLSRMVIVTR